MNKITRGSVGNIGNGQREIGKDKKKKENQK